MKIINVRGAHASGKTTAVREYVKKHGGIVEKIESGKWTSDITVINNGKIIVLGRYDIDGCTGCDRFKCFDQTYQTLKAVIAKYSPETIIFEGIMFSVVFKGSYEVAKIAKAYGYSYLGILLRRNRDEALSLMERRNGGTQRSLENFDAKRMSAERSAQKLVEAGEKVIALDVTGKSKEELCRILEING